MNKEKERKLEYRSSVERDGLKLSALIIPKYLSTSDKPLNTDTHYQAHFDLSYYDRRSIKLDFESEYFWNIFNSLKKAEKGIEALVLSGEREFELEELRNDHTVIRCIFSVEDQLKTKIDKDTFVPDGDPGGV